MRQLAILALFIAGTANAEFMPDGCYVSYSNPESCWTASDGVTQWTYYDSRADAVAHYGITVESITLASNEYRTSLAACQASLTNANTQWSAWYNLSKTKDKLIKKLKKACGSKCKKIK